MKEIKLLVDEEDFTTIHSILKEIISYKGISLKELPKKEIFQIKTPIGDLYCDNLEETDKLRQSLTKMFPTAHIFSKKVTVIKSAKEYFGGKNDD